jgi:hypothetical protein
MWTAINKVTDCSQHTVEVNNSATSGEVDIYYRAQLARLPLDDWLIIRNPVLLWFYRHGGEDPGWGKTPGGQAALAVALHELAGEVTDESLRHELQTVSGRLVAQAGRAIEQGLTSRPLMGVWCSLALLESPRP